MRARRSCVCVGGRVVQGGWRSVWEGQKGVLRGKSGGQRHRQAPPQPQRPETPPDCWGVVRGSESPPEWDGGAGGLLHPHRLNAVGFLGLEL